MDSELTTLYVKKGRRYVPWGNLGDSHLLDAMQVDEYRLVHCSPDGYTRTFFRIEPDCAAFVAASTIAREAMEKAILEKAKARPSAEGPYSPEQQKLIEEFREAMAKTGALVPSYWTVGSAWDIANAGIEAVKEAMEKSKEEG